MNIPQPLIKEWSAHVDKDGFIRWRRTRLFVTTALAFLTVAIEPEDDRWVVSYGPVILGYLLDDQLDRGLIRPRRRKQHRLNTPATDSDALWT